MSAFARLCALAALIISPGLLLAQEDYPPGTSQLTPTLDLELQPVEVEVPAQFEDALPEERVLYLPPGFSASVFAVQGLSGPRFLKFSPDGVLHVANMGRNQIVAFPDRDGDGVADEGIVALSGLREAHSLAFYKGDLYVAEEHQVIRARDKDGDYVYEEQEVFIKDIPWEGWHDTRTIVFDERHEKLYLSVGSPCDLCRQELGVQVVGNTAEEVPYSPERGAILQFNADGMGRRIFATGVRNVIGMDLHPVTGELWGTNNHYDLHGPHLPPEWIDILRDGGFYGLPFVYGYQAWIDFTIPEYRKLLPITPQDSLLVQTQKRPVALVPAHLAPMAIHFYTGDQFPARYRNAAFVALRGGQVEGNLAAVPGFKVIALFSEPDGARARAADFLTGFGTGPRYADVWGKPVGLTTDSQGNLYLTSDHTTYAVFKISHSPIIGSWEHNLPGQIVSGASLSLDLTVHLERLADQGEPAVTADLSDLGGPEALLLEKVGERTYRLRAVLDVAVPHGARRIRVLIEQGPHQFRLAHELTVLPGEDQVIFASASAANWAVEHNARLTPEPASQTLLYQGSPAQGFSAQIQGLASWNLEFVPPSPVNPEGYRALRFAFHPGTLEAKEGGALNLGINKSSSPHKRGPFNLLEGILDHPGVDLGVKDWQVVEIPMDALALEGPVESIRFFGNVSGTFYLEDLRLVTAAPEPTAVLEERAEGQPAGFALGQNYPNPFNSDTIIRFSLPASAQVELAVYNAAGQKVATLVSGARPPGLYTVRWDGRDDLGRALASGLYLYKLQTETQVETRKLLLLR